jgi:hypothetical protein
MIFNFSGWDDEGCSVNRYTPRNESALQSLHTRIHDGEENQEEQTGRLVACIRRREKIANAAIALILFNAILLPCLVFFGHPESAVYTVSLFNALLAAWAFYQKKGWETADFDAKNKR